MKIMPRARRRRPLGYLAACIVTSCVALTGAGGQNPSMRVFSGATVIDGTGRAPITDATILVLDGRIVAVGRAGDVQIAEGVEHIALDGKFIIPGLINTHGHVNTPADLTTYAQYGVTTVMSLGGEGEDVFAARASQNTPSLSRARVFVAGPVLAPNTPEEARAQVDALVPMKVDFVKIRVDDNLGTTPKMTPDVYRAVIDEAHAKGMRVATHLYYLADAKPLVRAGSDFVAHSVRDLPVDDAFLSALKASGKCYTPTLMREVSTFVYESTPDFFADPLFQSHANKDWVESLSQPQSQMETRNSKAAQTYKAQLPIASANLKRVFDAGIPVSMGTDTGPVGRFQGYFELMELEMMVKAGLTPAQALASATSVAARCLGHDQDIGTLQRGRWADLVVMDANPLDNIANVRRISSVWIAGNRVAR